MTSPDEPIRLEGGRTVVYRRGDVVLRETGPWTPAVHALPRHLERAGVTPETTAHPVALAAMAWRARSAAWMIRHRRILEAALAR